MARKIIYRENGLIGSNNTPSGYKYLGYDGLVLSEKAGATISAIGGGDYLPLAGGSLSGALTIQGTALYDGFAGFELFSDEPRITLIDSSFAEYRFENGIITIVGPLGGGMEIGVTANNEYIKFDANTSTLQGSSGTNNTWTLPDATGTLALTTDIPTISGTNKHFLQYQTLGGFLIDSPLSIEPGAGFAPDYHILSWKPGDGSIGEDPATFQVENFAGTSRWLTIASSGQGSLEWNNASFYGGIYINSNITLTGNRTWDMPDVSGTVALTKNQGYDNFIEVSISSAEILSLSTTPKDVLPVLTGSDYYDYKVIFEYTYGTTPYSNGGGGYFFIVDNFGRELTTMENLDALTYSFASNYPAFGAEQNQPARVRPATGLSCSMAFATTLGDGTVNLKVYYTTHTL